TDQSNVQKAVQDFTNPDAGASRRATAAARGGKPRRAGAPPAADTTVLVINGNGVTGSAGKLGYLLGQRSYRVVVPPSGRQANAPTFDYFNSKVYYLPGHPAYKAAAQTVANLIGSADVARLPVSIEGYGAAVTVVVGSTFHGSLAPAPVDNTPTHVPAAVTASSSQVFEFAKAAQRQLPFK